MKIIFSRKGFDSGAGGVPSPIFPDGKILSLPIPDKLSPIKYKDIKWNQYNLGEIVSDLTKGRITPNHNAHLDPDLRPESLKHIKGWKPIFGQVKSARGHLRNQSIQPGDIFLFFGLFQEVEIKNAKFRYIKIALKKHMIWGWLQIANIIPVDNCNKSKMQWALYHPHFHRESDATNTIYIAQDFLDFSKKIKNPLKGGCVFDYFSDKLQLTTRNSIKPSVWQLPEWFYPTDNIPPLTYHADLNRWEKQKGYALLKSVSRGQEFVLDCSHYPESEIWVKNLLTN